MGLDITIINENENKTAHIHWDYHRIHILREYACKMVNAKEEDSPEAKTEFPNLVWHSDAEGYYVGYLPGIWNEESQLWVGSTEGLFRELQKVQLYMVREKYKGEARKVLDEMLKLFADVNYDVEENQRYVIIIFS